MENLALTGHIEGMRTEEKNRVNCLCQQLCKWMAGHGLGNIVRRETLLRATDRKLWRAVIGRIPKEHGIQKIIFELP